MTRRERVGLLTEVTGSSWLRFNMSHRNGDRSIFRKVFIRISPVYQQASIRLSMTIPRSFYSHQLPTISCLRNAMKMETRGWISKKKQLTLTQVNEVLTEAMSLCGANFATRQLVFYAVELVNEGIRDEFAH